MQTRIESLSEDLAPQTSSTASLTFDKSHLKKLIEKIQGFDENEQYQILNILKENKQKFTENKNGIFINFSQLSIATLQQINQFVSFLDTQKATIETHDKMMKTMVDCLQEQQPPPIQTGENEK